MFIKFDNLSVQSPNAVQKSQELREWLYQNIEGFVDIHLFMDRAFSIIEVEGSTDAISKIREKLDWKRLRMEIIDNDTAESIIQRPLVFDDGSLITDFHGINGLMFMPEFLSNEDAEELESFIGVPEEFECIKDRFVWHYGFEFDYSRQSVTGKSIPPIPTIFHELILSRAIPICSVGPEYFNQMTIQIYPPGSGIPRHIDNPETFGDVLLVISLKSNCTMEFRNTITSKSKQVEMWPNSMVIMSKDSRYLWTHSIKERKTDMVSKRGCSALRLLQRQTRISLTFRHVK